MDVSCHRPRLWQAMLAAVYGARRLFRGDITDWHGISTCSGEIGCFGLHDRWPVFSFLSGPRSIAASEPCSKITFDEA